MMAILVLFIVLSPVALISSIKMEKFPRLLPTFSMVWVAGICVFAYQLVNNLILYKIRINASED